ncbi:MAG: hypothetical protein ACLFN4_04965 [Candidatus Acetothermia bacterium]
MTCIYCDKRKGQRECPALGGFICNRCCGEHRGADINCPPDCRYFKKHEQYQQSKEAENYKQAWARHNQSLIEEEEDNKIQSLLMLESLVYYRYEEEEATSLEDQSVIEGYKALGRKLKPIEVPGGETDFSAYLWSNLEPLIEQGRVEREELLWAVERFLEFAEEYTDGSRSLVQGMVGRMREDFAPPKARPGEERDLILTPGKLMESSRRRSDGGEGSEGGIIQRL